MSPQELQRFAQLVRTGADVLLTTWRGQVSELPSAKHLSVPVLNDHIPALLLEVAEAFETRSDVSITEALIEGTPVAHGEQRVADGFDIVEMVAEYNILRGCLHDLAVKHHLDMTGTAFHILNRVFDGAIGLAVESYATQQALEVQQRREEYLAFVAHDLRTPLNAISLATSMLGASLVENAVGDVAPIIGVLNRNVDRLRSLVQKVLEENTTLETELGVKLVLRNFELWSLVERLIHDLKPVGGSGSTLLVNKVPDNLVVHADASLLGRVFQNLIGNAINYTPRGSIEIGAQVLTTDGVVECWVSDTGKGIPEHLLDRIFHKGEGDSERVESSGLGLAIVKAFVEAHGGSVHAESVEGTGSTFRFTLPMRGSGAVAG